MMGKDYRGLKIRLSLAKVAFLILMVALPVSAAAEVDTSAPLVVGNRTIHVFRAQIGMFSPDERRHAASQRIHAVLSQSGEGWTSVKSTPQGVEVSIDNKPMFLIVTGDARAGSGETPEDLANAASRALQKVWSEAREARSAGANVEGILKVLLATVLFALATIVAAKLSGALRRRIVAAAKSRSDTTGRLGLVLPGLADKLLLLATWTVGLFVAFLYLGYSLSQFVLTRPAGESLARSIRELGLQALAAVADSVPGLFIASFIFLLAWVATHVATELFDSVREGPEERRFINTHTAPATRRIVNVSTWLFAIAMAYPYLPGSHTEAFKGLSVIVGIMVSIGASGVVGQVASGVMIVYTYALRVGEYVRIAEHEGTVTEIGVFVTRLRTGMGEEIAIPNTFVQANVTRNFSRAGGGGDYVLDAVVTIGYDVSWRLVHELLLEAAAQVPQIRKEPVPYVMQTALSDFYVAYKLVTHVDATVPAARAKVASDLHAAIQDAFNRRGVQIMSPHYEADPAAPKIVPESAWHSTQASPGS